MLNLDNKTALITGASGGIGGAIAKLFHSLGVKLILSGTNTDNLNKLSEELRDRHHVIPFDLKNHSKIPDFIDEVYGIYGELDILVCNAGVTKDNLALRMTEENFKEVIDINLVSSFLINKSAVKYMIKNKYGRIINISSVVAFTGNAGQVNYAAAKAGLIAMSKSLAIEVASRNINVNVVAPGFIETPMTDGLSDSHKENLLNTVPLARFGKPEDIAGVVTFLASNQANYITGQTIHVNGGMLMV